VTRPRPPLALALCIRRSLVHQGGC
jgi:hypothetical protein